jgi:hypothetical protein
MFLFIVFFIFFAISLAGSFNKLPFQRHIYRQSIFSQDGILNAYLFLSKETDLHAILNTSIPWYSTGGYYYLHRDVPIYSSDHFDPNDSKNYLPYVSHIVCPAGYRDIPGFRTVKEMKSIEIRKQINPPSEYQSTPYDTKNVMQEGIDDKYTPDIHK